ncbi:nucleoredoxin-like protein 2 [Ornithodoros turicata]|uniref:nucleoredoxin-like protein 2 n=1 Tax=Ornithodoros turicata TaxID=34597 RepID=UPI0031399596
MDLLKGKRLVKRDGTIVAAETALKGKKLICFYMAAHWCPPCRMFTNTLADAYVEAKDEALPIEVIFISSDRTAADMANYMRESHGDWLGLPYGDPLQPVIKQRYKVSGIPTLIVLKDNGTMLCRNGRPDVQSKGAAAFRDWCRQ